MSCSPYCEANILNTPCASWYIKPPCSSLALRFLWEYQHSPSHSSLPPRSFRASFSSFCRSSLQLVSSQRPPNQRLFSWYSALSALRAFAVGSPSECYYPAFNCAFGLSIFLASTSFTESTKNSQTRIRRTISNASDKNENSRSALLVSPIRRVSCWPHFWLYQWN